MHDVGRGPSEWRARVVRALLQLGVAGTASAQVPELVTDRPDQTESSRVVPHRATQVETGASWARDDEDGPSRTSTEIGGTLVRFGLLERLELRAGWTGYAAEDDGSADGLGDAELGAKWGLGAERGRRPELALIVDSSLPTGADRVSSERFDPRLRVCASHTLTERVGLGYNLGAGWESEEGDDGQRHTLGSALYTTSLAIGLTDDAGMFVELFGAIPTSAEGGPAHAFDLGFTYLVRPNLQLDVAGGVGLSEDADDAFVGLGLSIRLPR